MLRCVTYLVYPFILSEFRVKGSFLQRPELESETRTEFLQTAALVVFAELVAVVSHEDKVTLVVEGHHATTLKLRVVRKESLEHSTHRQAQSGVKIVEN